MAHFLITDEVYFRFIHFPNIVLSGIFLTYCEIQNSTNWNVLNYVTKFANDGQI